MPSSDQEISIRTPMDAVSESIDMSRSLAIAREASHVLSVGRPRSASILGDIQDELVRRILESDTRDPSVEEAVRAAAATPPPGLERMTESQIRNTIETIQAQMRRNIERGPVPAGIYIDPIQMTSDRRSSSSEQFFRETLGTPVVSDEASDVVSPSVERMLEAAHRREMEDRDRRDYDRRRLEERRLRERVRAEERARAGIRLEYGGNGVTFPPEEAAMAALRQRMIDSGALSTGTTQAQHAVGTASMGSELRYSPFPKVTSEQIHDIYRNYNAVGVNLPFIVSMALVSIRSPYFYDLWQEYFEILVEAMNAEPENNGKPMFLECALRNSYSKLKSSAWQKRSGSSLHGKPEEVIWMILQGLNTSEWNDMAQLLIRYFRDYGLPVARPKPKTYTRPVSAEEHEAHAATRFDQ